MSLSHSRPRVLATLFALATVSTSVLASDDTPYREEIQKWRAAREERLKADGGWLSVAGLYWLREGENRLGSDSKLEIALPKGAAPADAGVVRFQQGKITLRLAAGVVAELNGKPAATGADLPLRPDTSGEADVLKIGRLTMHVIQRADRFGIRMKDPEAQTRREFKGLTWFPVDSKHRVVGRFVPYKPARTIPIPNVLGQVEESTAPGYVVFTLGGRELRLDPILEDPKATELFFIFRDQTSGNDTYGAGRFLYATMPKDGEEGPVTLDFNKAYSPPCAFTAYATCPLPPPQNRLTLRIEAGEKFAGHAH